MAILVLMKTGWLLYTLRRWNDFMLALIVICDTARGEATGFPQHAGRASSAAVGWHPAREGFRQGYA